MLPSPRPALAAARRCLDRLGRRVWGALPDTDEQFVRQAYRMVLGREADPAGLAGYVGALEGGEATRAAVVDALVDSPEFFFTYDDGSHLLALHLGRAQFVAGLPAAARILDLGGTALGDPAGALVLLGYRHRFEQLVIVDLPADQRHDLYDSEPVLGGYETALGPVEYRYHSMTELDQYPDASFDLVYSGQTIEHVTEPEADQVLAGVYRVLAPGGWFCLDTPNGPVCRHHTAELINPDHKIEYGHGELVAKLAWAGFTVERAEGIGYVGESVRRGSFSFRELVRNWGVHADPGSCYLLAYHCRRP